MYLLHQLMIIWQTKRDFPTVHNRSLNLIIISEFGIEAVRKSAIRLATTPYIPKHG